MRSDYIVTYRRFGLSLIQYLVVGFEVLRAVIMKCTVFWDVTTCTPVVHRLSEEPTVTIITSLLLGGCLLTSSALIFLLSLIRYNIYTF
jgi:hypothetical protein